MRHETSLTIVLLSANAQGQTIVAVCGAAALAIGVAIGSAPLLATLVGSAVLGAVYSMDLPLMRWKRSPVLAAACILAVRCDLGSFGSRCQHMKVLLVKQNFVMSLSVSVTKTVWKQRWDQC